MLFVAFGDVYWPPSFFVAFDDRFVKFFWQLHSSSDVGEGPTVWQVNKRKLSGVCCSHYCFGGTHYVTRTFVWGIVCTKFNLQNRCCCAVASRSRLFDSWRLLLTFSSCQQKKRKYPTLLIKLTWILFDFNSIFVYTFLCFYILILPKFLHLSCNDFLELFFFHLTHSKITHTYCQQVWAFWWRHSRAIGVFKSVRPGKFMPGTALSLGA